MKLEEARIINIRELNRIIATAEIDGEYGAAKALKRFKESFKEIGPVIENAFEAGWVYGHSTIKETYPNKETYIKTLEL
jgi:ADP-dependent phosphofructokinase/glucokinase